MLQQAEIWVWEPADQEGYRQSATYFFAGSNHNDNIYHVVFRRGENRYSALNITHVGYRGSALFPHKYLFEGPVGAWWSVNEVSALTFASAETAYMVSDSGLIYRAAFPGLCARANLSAGATSASLALGVSCALC